MSAAIALAAANALAAAKQSLWPGINHQKDCFASLIAMDGMYAENAGAFFCRNDGSFGDGVSFCLFEVCFLAHRAQPLVEESQLGYQVTPTPGFKLRSAARTGQLAKVFYRSYQLDFIDREAEIFQNAVRRQWIDLGYCLAHDVPQLKNEEEI